MGALIRDRHFKPAPWGWQRARVAPECKWALRGLVIALPCWEGHGADSATAAAVKCRDPINKHVATSNTGKVLGIGGRRGRVLRSTAAGSSDPRVSFDTLVTK